MAAAVIATFFRWRLHPGSEAAFARAWANVTEALRAHGSYGSALFRDSDGCYRALARWPDRATRDRGFAAFVSGADSQAMHAAIAKTIERVDADEIDNRWIGPDA